MSSKKIFLVCWLLGMLFNTSAQTLYYHDLVQIAEIKYDSTEYDSACYYYEKAFDRFIGYREHHVGAAKAFIRAGDNNMGITHIERAIEQRFFDLDQFENEIVFLSLKKKDRKFLKNLLVQKKKNHESGLNQELKKELEEMCEIDQWLRTGWNDRIVDSFGFRSEEFYNYWKVVDYVDSLKMIRLEEFVDEYGWPGISLVGEKANKSAWLIVQHSPLSYMEKFLPIIKESCEMGETPWKYYPYVHDRVMIYKGSKTTKYCCACYFDEEKNDFVWDSLEFDKVDLYREEMGLPPLFFKKRK